MNGAALDELPTATGSGRSEYRLWRVYDAGGVVPCLKVRFHDDAEVPDWRRGPDLAAARARAAADGWHAYDSEPGNAPGEHSIIHLKRSV